MSKIYIADKNTLDKVLERTDAILANLMAINDDETTKTKVAANYFATRRTGKVFGVSFNGSSSPAGTRKFDAVGMIAKPSTDTVAERNDFDNYAIFNGLTVNGHVETNGDFTVEAFEGESGFSKTDKDVYILLGTSWVKIDITSSGETISVTDKPRDGYFPMPGAVKSDGTVRPFIAMAKYMASEKGGKASSVSGAIPYHNNVSHNNCITKFHTKGTQYCATTAQDRFLIETYFQVIFATRDSQSIMKGCTSYNFQEAVAKVESGAKNRVLVTKGKGKQYVVGSRASVGSDSSAINKDRNHEKSKDLADRRLITKIEENVTVDTTQYDAIYLDGAAFTVADTKAFISTMPWDTGVCDGVLGSCGSLVDNTSGKYPFVFCGIEMMNGQYEVMGNVIYNQTGSSGSWKGAYKVCYDATKLATASSDENYKAISYQPDLTGSTTGVWKYTSEIGFDANNPGVRLPYKLAGSTSTGYCDGCYIGNDTGDKEVLLGGYLSSGTSAGVWCRSLNLALSNALWSFGARLSATGICGAKAK